MFSDTAFRAFLASIKYVRPASYHPNGNPGWEGAAYPYQGSWTVKIEKGESRTSLVARNTDPIQIDSVRGKVFEWLWLIDENGEPLTSVAIRPAIKFDKETSGAILPAGQVSIIFGTISED